MALITLSNGSVVQVDDCDLSRVAGYNWHLHPGGYAIARPNGKSLYMHRLVINASSRMEVDHINGDKLDNRRNNLRLVSRQQNEQNKAYTSAQSGVRGVSYDGRRAKPWRAEVYINRKRIHLGYFDNVAEAAQAVLAGRKQYHSHSFVHTENVAQ